MNALMPLIVFYRNNVYFFPTNKDLPLVSAFNLLYFLLIFSLAHNLVWPFFLWVPGNFPIYLF